MNNAELVKIIIDTLQDIFFLFLVSFITFMFGYIKGYKDRNTEIKE